MLLLFGITFLPLNILHQHDENLHHAAMLSGHNVQHSCELDAYACQAALSHNCAHQAHINAALTHCFSCKFHFIKVYDTCPHPGAAVCNENQYCFGQHLVPMAAAPACNPSNKSPPVFA